MMLRAVMIDSREPSEVLKLDYGAPTVTTPLECGDLWATCADGELLVIERKTPSDLLASIGDNRLLMQAKTMRERSQWAYIVITGWLAPTHDNKTLANNRLTGWNWNSVQGALLSVQEMGVSVLYCADDYHYPKTIQWLARRQRGAKILRPTEHNVRVMSPGERVLTALPGIGLERAQALLEHRSPAHALAFLTWMAPGYEEFDEILGIGDGIRANVRRALGLEPNETLELHQWNPRQETQLHEHEQHNSTDNTATATATHVGDDSGHRADGHRQPALWGEYQSSGRGDYAPRT